VIAATTIQKLLLFTLLSMTPCLNQHRESLCAL